MNLTMDMSYLIVILQIILILSPKSIFLWSWCWRDGTLYCISKFEWLWYDMNTLYGKYGIINLSLQVIVSMYVWTGWTICLLFAVCRIKVRFDQKLKTTSCRFETHVPHKIPHLHIWVWDSGFGTIVLRSFLRADIKAELFVIIFVKRKRKSLNSITAVWLFFFFFFASSYANKQNSLLNFSKNFSNKHIGSK